MTYQLWPLSESAKSLFNPFTTERVEKLILSRDYFDCLSVHHLNNESGIVIVGNEYRGHHTKRGYGFKEPFRGLIQLMDKKPKANNLARYVVRNFIEK